MKTSLKLALALGLLLSSFSIGYGAASSDMFLTDVSENDWYYQSVNQLVNYGMLQGYEDSTFRGSNNLNRAEMAVMMVRMMDLVKNSCIDVDAGKLYYEGDEWNDGEAMYQCMDGQIQETGAIN